jgi:thiamine-phosphate pyrophosphorylase
MLGRVAAAVDGGVNLVQLRAKEMPGGQLLALATELKRTIDGRAALLVNERVDVAAAARVDGVQLGEEALPVSAASGLLPPGSLVGRSIHSVEGAEKAASDGADFLMVGTMFATASHPGARPAGPELMRSIAAQCDLPLIGIGGITADNVAEVVEGGASGVAVIRSVLTADDPRAAASDLMSALRQSRANRASVGRPS